MSVGVEQANMQLITHDHAESVLGMVGRDREDRRDGQAGAGARGLVRPRVCGGRPWRY